MRQCSSVFLNLIKNACEASPQGGVVLIRFYDQTPLKISIVNKGAVPKDIRERFFDKYVTAGKQAGTGLGTYSAKLLTEAQNGQIELAVSDEDNSTTISVMLPKA